MQIQRSCSLPQKKKYLTAALFLCLLGVVVYLVQQQFYYVAIVQIALIILLGKIYRDFCTLLHKQAQNNVFLEKQYAKSKNLESMQQRLLQIIGSTSDIVSTATPDGRVMYINDAGRKIMGWDNDLSQKKISDAHPQHVLQYMKEEVIPVAIRDGIWRGENFMSTKDGDELPVSQILMSHKSSDGKLEYLSTIMRDITQQKNIEKQLKQASLNAEMANKAKSEFLANMSHEIRTPMNAILGFTVILSELISDEKQKEYLRSIQTSGKSLLSLINDILDLSKVEAGKLSLEYTTVNMQQICKEMQQIFATKIANKGLNFCVEMDEEMPEAFILDEVRLRQVLVNIIGNAVKFTSSGYIKLGVKSQSVGEDEVSLTISVEDTGMGIPDAQKQIIFNAFEQQQGQSHAVFGGTGLGLAITKRLVEMMEGSIRVADNKPRGCRFIINLTNVTISSVSRDSEPQEFIDAQNIVFEPAVILIADDIDVNRELVRLFLNRYDFDFIEACNGEEAVNLTKEHLPDLIFMDIKMPVVNGYEATRQIKLHDNTKYIPIIALTASAMKQDEEQLKKICDGFLSKPVAKNQLIGEIAKFLPHRTKENTPQAVCKEDDENTNDLNTNVDTQALLNEIYRKKEQCAELSETLDINDIEQLGEQIKALGVEHNYQPLITWGEDLQTQAAMFDLENLPQTLKKYQSIIEKLEHLNNPS